MLVSLLLLPARGGQEHLSETDTHGLSDPKCTQYNRFLVDQCFFCYSHLN